MIISLIIFLLKDNALFPLVFKYYITSTLLFKYILLQLTEFVQSENATDILCSNELWDAFVLPANGSAALKHLQEEACSMNSTLLMWQSFVVQMKGYTLKQQVCAELNNTGYAGKGP